MNQIALLVALITTIATWTPPAPQHEVRVGIFTVEIDPYPANPGIEIYKDGVQVEKVTATTHALQLPRMLQKAFGLPGGIGFPLIHITHQVRKPAVNPTLGVHPVKSGKRISPHTHSLAAGP
jgi:hypothetical protein